MKKKEKKHIRLFRRIGDKTKNRLRTAVKYVLVTGTLLAFLGAAAAFTVSGAVVRRTHDRVITAEEAADLSDVDCVIVLGCGVKEDGTPSAMLSDRVSTGIALYEAGVSDRLLMSGDHSRVDYDEVNVMKRLATEAGIDPEVVFCDHAGFSTYESIYRVRDIFGAKKIVIVSQEYHLYRAIYIAEKLGLDAYGVSADLRPYAGQKMRDIREAAARFKDFFFALLQPEPTYLGEKIPLDGSASATDG